VDFDVFNPRHLKNVRKKRKTTETQPASKVSFLFKATERSAIALSLAAVISDFAVANSAFSAAAWKGKMLGFSF
jgi:hypothetical protein